MDKKILIDKDLLYDLYIMQNKSQKFIAKQLNCSVNTIQKVLKDYKIVKPKYEDLTGKRFGRLLVLKRGEDVYNSRGTKYITWICQCNCGNKTTIKAADLKRGRTRSCGCYHKEWNKLTKTRTNKYDLSGEYGIGYTLKNEPFYFDLEDFDKIKDYCWSYNSDGYVVARKRGSKETVRIHQFGMGAKHIDHIKHVLHDNRKSQLRIGNDLLNARNRSRPKNNKSGHIGVCWKERDKLWEAYIGINGKHLYLGHFNKYEDALMARKNAEEKYYGSWSYDNSMNII